MMLGPDRLYRDPMLSKVCVSCTSLSVAARRRICCASSWNIASAFGKQHKHVLEKIDNLLKNAPDLLGPNFRPKLIETTTGNSATRHDRAYEMDRSSFSLLALALDNHVSTRHFLSSS